MRPSSDTIRRWTGAIFLTIAVAMLAAGLTVLEGRLEPFTFIMYWMGCMAFTLSAATVALLDISAVRRKAIRAHRELIEDTLQEIQHERVSEQDDATGHQRKDASEGSDLGKNIG
jgi:hypothetical protein